MFSLQHQEQGRPLLPLLRKVLEVLVRAVMQEHLIKASKKSKLSSLADDTILYTDNSNESTKNTIRTNKLV